VPLPRRTEADLKRAFTGLVVESLAVRQDVTCGTVRCVRCVRSESGSLAAGDRVVVVLRDYEGFTWEIQDVCCPAHGVGRVGDAVGIEADDQAVVSAVLEAAGYRSPDGTYHPEALTLGDVEMLDFSPAEDGYGETDARDDPDATDGRNRESGRD
jgi:hypothetical protein